ncbi:carboxypeptidase S [Favolaschia claudopus]|uniref:Carboxypeptidase S n=1 Tax=Favolaschia claudopus TaxID=2862362 RepID=A0AAW0C0G3_9AGAR
MTISSEKLSLWPVVAPMRLRSQTHSTVFIWISLVLFVGFWAAEFEGTGIYYLRQRSQSLVVTDFNICPQVDILVPDGNAAVWRTVLEQTASSSFRVRAIDFLAGAVRIPTESYDNMQPVGVDPRWEIFGELHDYLTRSFPLVHAHLKLRKVNTYGLWYEWRGLDQTLKPILINAHQDVVPVEPLTTGDWDHAPYSGYFDGQNIWGRGSADDKNGLVGIMTAIEVLLENGFTPTRTVVTAFGFDEEATGLEGAWELAKALLAAYGPDAFAFIIDEGDGLVKTFDTVVAYPCVAEKGYLDVVVEVTSPGGHSSIPPPHTTIGILAALLVEYEANPYPVQLTRASTPFQTLECLAQYGRTLPPTLRALIFDSVHSDAALRSLEGILSKDKLYRTQIGTTQAIDVISGGVKSNALPEEARAIINHRILAESSVDAVHQHNTAVLRPLAERFNLSFNAFGVLIPEFDVPASGHLTLSDLSQGLEPAPVTPTTGENSAPYQLLSGTIRATYASRHGASVGDPATVIVAPSMMTGNTDTQFYWKLSPHIFRYGHGNGAGQKLDGMMNNIHTVNEFMDADDFVEMIRFFITLILNADESVAL